MSAATRIVAKETELLRMQQIMNMQKESGKEGITVHVVDFEFLLHQMKNAIAYERTLNFYAEEYNYVHDEDAITVGLSNRSLIMRDFGERAQDTLEENY